MLRNQTGCELAASEQMEQALNGLHLPPSLLQKLQTSVYNAVVRICAAHVEGEVWVHLFVAGPALAAEQADGDPAGQINRGAPAADPGWGFFLIERRASAGTSGSEAWSIVELYCYQEGS
ncbi:MAG: hypothetical protein DCC55_08555 [Chloroflexi bacterium]|nr:MAG: hypothetical protein DCC55_08555 [Chloroflexota bacterium]